MAQSGHARAASECLLSGVKRTSKFKSVTSAFDPYATWNDGFGLMLPTLPGATNEFATLSAPEVCASNPF